MKVKKAKALKNTLRLAMAVFIVAPVLLVSIMGLTAVSSQTAELAADTSAAAARSQSNGISVLVGEYIAFLDAVAGLEAIQRTAIANESAFRSQAREIMRAHAENIPGIADVLLTDSSGRILISYLDEHNPGDTFRKSDVLLEIGGTPAPVSEFYGSNTRFFCARPISADMNIVGHIILEADTDLITSSLSRSFTGDRGGVFALFDESGSIISSTGEHSNLLRDCVSSYRAGAFQNIESFERGRHFGNIGKIAGTRWRWISLEPISEAAAMSWSVFAIAFTVAVGISLVNLVLLLRFSATLFKPLTILSETLERASGKLSNGGSCEPDFTKIAGSISRQIEFAQMCHDLNTILEQAEEEYNAALAAEEEALSGEFKPAVDFLTGLYSRNTFAKMLDELLLKLAADSSVKPEDTAVMLMEVNDFKGFCVAHGNDAGDFLLKFTAEKLKSVVKYNGAGSFAGRFIETGGEFALCIAKRPSQIDDTDSILQVCKAITEVLEEGYVCPFANTGVSVCVNIGVASADSGSARDIITCADECVYLAKKTGKSYHIKQ
jgi:diguanylate cyclase (GGDEF)-like protein